MPADRPLAAPRESFEDLCERGVGHLASVIAIDSASDEQSPTIPSSPGQRAVIEHLRAFFSGLGFACEEDAQANLIVRVPARGAAAGAPKIAFMTHVDTSQGTRAVERLEVVPGWRGERIRYPRNPRLHVSRDTYPETACFLGEDVLHGPGEAPVGLDDKLGIAELMGLAEVLAANPDLERPELLLVFRPDEEIGRMAAVEGLAVLLAARGVRYGYTNDGLLPFEINTENFHASRARVTVAGQPLPASAAAAARRVVIDIVGVKSHGATAKPEGYRNATVIFAEAVRALGASAGGAIVPLGLASSHAAEVNATLEVLLRGADAAALEGEEARLLAALEAAIAAHRWRGADLSVRERTSSDPKAPGATDAALRLARHLDRFLASAEPAPLLSEDSEGYQGYTNPCFAERTADGAGQALVYRIRAFDRGELDLRERHVRTLAADPADPLGVEVEQQYVNMGPALAPYPELVAFAEQALEPLGQAPRRLPIRGGTGVDPFLTRGIPIANLGTGYFAPESEKELTSRQSLGRHVLWLVNLVQVIARAG